MIQNVTNLHSVIINRLKKHSYLIVFCSYGFLKGQSYGDFKNEKFPIHLIDESIIKNRNLKPQIKILNEQCNWKDRVGEKIDIFWLQTAEGNFYGHVYEYFIDCDNLRFIYWYDNPRGKGKIIDFMIEDLEDDSMFVTSKRKYLRNKKKYIQYLTVDD